MRTGSIVRRRRGVLLFELIISGLVLGLVMAATIPLLGWIARERKLNRRRQTALLEVGNLMERLNLLEWDELTGERAATFTISAEGAHDLPESKLKVAIATDPAEAGSKHILIELAFEGSLSNPAPPARLAAWVYRDARRPKQDIP